MLNRLLSRQSTLRALTLISSKNLSVNLSPHSLYNLRSPCPNPSSDIFLFKPRHFSSNHHNNGDDRQKSITEAWDISKEKEQTLDSVFGDEDGGLEGISGGGDEGPAVGEDVFEGIDVGNEVKGSVDGDDEFKAWSLAEEEKGDDVFDIGEDVEVDMSKEIRGDDEREEIRKKSEEDRKKSEEDRKLEEEKQFLSTVLKGPGRAFGDLIAASGITEEMLDSLMALKDLDGVQGLPPLREIEDLRYEKNTRKSSRAEIERQKQEEVVKARVRLVDNKGRAYGTGRRKCSIARVWIQPGDGKFVVNDKEIDVYFPMLDHRAALLRPFSETKTLGLWDISCTVKGGGVSGQVGAVQLGMSRALQNWEPALRPPLRAAGFLTRDPRVVERKKPGKAKARKSFQWVKR